MEAGPLPNVFLVGLAMLNGLADLAEQRPLLVAVDDANWLDQASAQTLSFVARRLQLKGVGLVFAVRESLAELEGLLELPIVGLAAEDARRPLRSVLRVNVDEAILERFIAETEGNPLAVLELSSGLASPDPEGMFDRRDPRGLWVQLEDSFRRRVEALDGDAGMLLLIPRRSRRATRSCFGVRWMCSASRAMPRARLRKRGCYPASSSPTGCGPMVRASTR